MANFRSVVVRASVWLALSSVCTPGIADSGQSAALHAPIATSNRNPFVQLYGLPAAQSAQLVGQGQRSAALQLDVANSFSQHSKGNEAIVIDGETLRANLQLRFGLAESLELGVDIPYLSHDGGSLDSFIDEWHSLWGLPDGDRPDYPRDQLQFAYQRQGSAPVALTRSEQGLGDVSISLAHQWRSEPTRQWALRTAIKLPTGDADAFLGSESTDISLGVHVSDQSLAERYGVRWHGSMGLLWLDEGELLTAQREDWVVYGSATLSWQWTKAVSLKVQLDGHSAFYDSALTELGSDAAQLSLGGTVRLNQRWLLDLAVVEDIAVDTSPDVVFHLAIKALQW